MYLSPVAGLRIVILKKKKDNNNDDDVNKLAKF